MGPRLTKFVQWIAYAVFVAAVVGFCWWSWCVSRDVNWSWSYKDRVQEIVRAEMKKVPVSQASQEQALAAVLACFKEGAKSMIQLHDRVEVQEARIQFLESRIKTLEAGQKPMPKEEKP